MKVLLVLLLSCAAWAQDTHCVGYGCDIPNAPQPKPKVHSFFDTQNLVTFSSSAVALVGEANMSCTVPGTECKQVTAGAGGFFIAEVSLAAVFHHTGHHTMERGVGVSTVLFHLGRMVWISTHRK